MQVPTPAGMCLQETPHGRTRPSREPANGGIVSGPEVQDEEASQVSLTPIESAGGDLVQPPHPPSDPPPAVPNLEMLTPYITIMQSRPRF